MTEDIKLKIEKNIATMEFHKIQPFIFSQNFQTQLKYKIEQVINNPSIHVAILIFHNNSMDINLKEIEKIHSKEKLEGLLDEVYNLFYSMEKSHISWIAATHNICIENQLALALACNYRIADRNTVFGLPALSFGMIPAFGSCVRLPHLIGVRKTLEIILNRQIISSQQAYEISLINDIVHRLSLEETAHSIAEQIIKGQIPPKPLQKYKPQRLLDKLFEIPLSRQILYYMEKRKILEETKKFYPSPLNCLNLIKSTYSMKSIKNALKEESNVFRDTVVSRTTKHLISLHCTRDKILKKFDTPKEENNSIIKKIAILGAGSMGRKITHWLANHHFPVLLKDIHPPSLSSSLSYIHSMWDKQLQKNNISLFKKENQNIYPSWDKPANTKKISLEEKEKRSSKIRPQIDYSGFKSVNLVIEAVVEDIDIKKKVISETAQQLNENCLFATNTSSLSVTELAKAYPDPSRFFGLHFFQPVYKTPLVEIVKGEQTSDTVITCVFQWIKQLNKVPFIVKDTPGFLVHRLFLSLISEALWLLHEGISIQNIDKAYTSFGFSMGPFRLMDELGLDICLKLIKSLQSSSLNLDFPEEAFQLRPVFLGKKNKSGFYIYNEKLKVESVNNLIYQDLKLKPTSSSSISPIECLERGLYRMINESARVLEEQIVETPEELDLALTLGIGFPAFRGGLLKYADEVSLKTIISNLNHFASKWGHRFLPSAPLLEREKIGKNFYKM